MKGKFFSVLVFSLSLFLAGIASAGERANIYGGSGDDGARPSSRPQMAATSWQVRLIPLAQAMHGS